MTIPQPLPEAKEVDPCPTPDAMWHALDEAIRAARSFRIYLEAQRPDSLFCPGRGFRVDPRTTREYREAVASLEFAESLFQCLKPAKAPARRSSMTHVHTEIDRLIDAGNELRYLIDSQPAGSIPVQFGPKQMDVRESETYKRACALLSSGELFLKHLDGPQHPPEMVVGGVPAGDAEAKEGAEGFSGSDDVFAKTEFLLVVLGFEVRQQPARGSVNRGLVVTGFSSKGLLQHS